MNLTKTQEVIRSLEDTAKIFTKSFDYVVEVIRSLENTAEIFTKSFDYVVEGDTLNVYVCFEYKHRPYQAHAYFMLSGLKDLSQREFTQIIITAINNEIDPELDFPDWQGIKVQDPIEIKVPRLDLSQEEYKLWKHMVNHKRITVEKLFKLFIRDEKE